MAPALAAAASRDPRWRLGVDVGGTFTDVALVDERNGRTVVHKTPTRHDDLVGTVVQGVREILVQHHVAASDVAYLAAGSTIALNTIIERSGCRTGLLVTRGFRDVLEIRRNRLPDAPNFDAARPIPLVPRSRVAEVEERIHVSGRVVRPLDEAAARAAVAALVEDGVEAIAVCLLHSYTNPRHEQRIRDLLAEGWPDVLVCVSSDIWPQQREFERALLAVMNAYIGPRMVTYYGSLEQAMRDTGLHCPLLMTQSNGGMLSIEEAARTPVRTVLSGPAVGVTGAARVAGDAGHARVFTLDMGGTSADMAVVDGQPRLGTENLVGQYPYFMPAIEIDTIGAGGGSIAYWDAHGALKVGPRSAGSVPGPACYDRGGVEPTVTDAYLLTGIIGETDLLGGAMRLSRERANEAVAGLAGRLGVAPVEAAEGIIRVATANMHAGLLPLIAKHGADYTRFCLMAYGGAGPTHAFMLAADVGIRSVLVPATPGGMCGVGGALTDQQMDFVVSGRWDLDDHEAIDDAFASLEARAGKWLAAQGIPTAAARHHRTADMRYQGQSFELTVSVDDLHEQQASEFHRRYA
ncbi:MAG: hydantoinase/oxoprolinase family protein, partial [Streptosporangiales bacterium]|nr:hydantoinase/oxoprolinase family protein [Streptosporangiales bacterium]